MRKYSGAEVFSSKPLKQYKTLNPHLNLKVTSSLQYAKCPSSVRFSFVLKSSEGLFKYDKTEVNSLLGIMKLRSIWINNSFKNLLTQWFPNTLG